MNGGTVMDDKHYKGIVETSTKMIKHSKQGSTGKSTNSSDSLLKIKQTQNDKKK